MIRAQQVAQLCCATFGSTSVTSLVLRRAPRSQVQQRCIAAARLVATPCVATHAIAALAAYYAANAGPAAVALRARSRLQARRPHFRRAKVA